MVAASEIPYPPQRQAWYCVAVLALATTVQFLDRGILNLLAETIKRDLRLTDVQMGLVMGFAFTFFYAVFGLPVARMIDRGIRKRILAAGLGIFAVTTLLLGRASSFGQLFIARMGQGIGETTAGPSSYSLLSDYFPPARLIRAISVMQLGIALGSATALLLGGYLIATVGAHSYDLPLLGQVKGWQSVLMLASLPGLVVMILMTTVKEPLRRGAAKTTPPVGEVFRLVLRHKRVYLSLFFGIGLRSVQSSGVQVWMAPFYQRTYGWDPKQFSVVMGISGLLALPLGLFLGNLLTEHLFKKGYSDAPMRATVIGTLLSVPLWSVFPLLPGPWICAAIFTLAIMTSVMVAAPENAALQNVTPNRLRGQITFLLLFLINVIGMGLGPLVVGVLSQYIFGEENIRYSLLVAGLLMGIPAIGIFWMGLAPYRRAIGRIEPLHN